MPRRPRLLTQIEDTQAAISAELSGGNTKPNRSNLLAAKLQSQMALLEREDAQKHDAIVTERESLQKELIGFRELNTTPDEVSRLRQSNAALTAELETLRGNSQNAAVEIAGLKSQIESLRRTLTAERDRLLRGVTTQDITIKEWLKFQTDFSTKDVMIDYLRQSRKKPANEKIKAYCTQRLQIEFNITPEVLGALFEGEDERQRRENVERAQEQQIRTARAANLQQPRGIAGDREFNPEWRQPVPERIDQPAISGGLPFSPWVE